MSNFLIHFKWATFYFLVEFVDLPLSATFSSFAGNAISFWDHHVIFWHFTCFLHSSFFPFVVRYVRVATGCIQNIYTRFQRTWSEIGNSCFDVLSGDARKWWATQDTTATNSSKNIILNFCVNCKWKKTSMAEWLKLNIMRANAWNLQSFLGDVDWLTETWRGKNRKER